MFAPIHMCLRFQSLRVVFPQDKTPVVCAPSPAKVGIDGRYSAQESLLRNTALE